MKKTELQRALGANTGHEDLRVTADGREVLGVCVDQVASGDTFITLLLESNTPVERPLVLDRHIVTHPAWPPDDSLPVIDAEFDDVPYHHSSYLSRLNQAVDRERRNALRPFLSVILGVPSDDLSEKVIDDLITIGKGMFLSEPIDKKIREIVNDIEREFTNSGMLGS